MSCFKKVKPKSGSGPPLFEDLPNAPSLQMPTLPKSTVGKVGMFVKAVFTGGSSVVRATVDDHVLNKQQMGFKVGWLTPGFHS